jgi:hypothetical protein
MAEFFKLIAELIFNLPWMYKGWEFLFSGECRVRYKKEWENYGNGRKFLDWFLTIGFMATEIYLIYFLWQKMK